MEKSWDQITREVTAMLDHQSFSEKLILVLFAFSMMAGLVGAPKVWTLLWLLPLAGYLLGRHLTENHRAAHRDYWICSAGSQALLAIMVGVPALIRFG